MHKFDEEGDYMIEPIKILTNNPMSRENFEKKYDVEFVNGNVNDVYIKVRDYIHKGHRLLTHPLMSSVKPNEIPYRTVIITKQKGDIMDMDSLMIIESSIETLNKFLKDFSIPNWSENVLEDFKLIDYDLIFHAIN